MPRCLLSRYAASTEVIEESHLPVARVIFFRVMVFLSVIDVAMTVKTNINGTGLIRKCLKRNSND